jgi:hypothetical protein
MDILLNFLVIVVIENAIVSSSFFGQVEKAIVVTLGSFGIAYF